MTARVQDPEIQKLRQALLHLNDLLPLKARQDSLTPENRKLHRSILQTLVEKGRVMSEDEIAKVAGSPAAGRSAVALLGAYDLVVRGPLTVTDARTGREVVVDAIGGEVVGAYPVTTEVTPHRITVNGHSIYAMCAVDALAVAPLFGGEVRIDSVCHVTGEPIHIAMKGKKIVECKPCSAEEMRIGVRWQRVTTTAAHGLCRQMVFLKDAATAAKWQSRDPGSIDIFTSAEAMDFAEAFFRPLLAD